MGFYRDTENYAWINQAGPGVGADPAGGAVVGPPAPPPIGGGAAGAFPSCASTMNQCPCSYGGCMDNSYMEYDANATCDNGSCATPIVAGCMTPSAINYNPAANVDDGSCIGAISGCTDPNATNYNAQANTDCSGNIVQGGGGAAQPQPGGNIGFNGYSNASGCGNTYSNFNQQGFGGYNDQLWFND
tara:strand:- start:1932 stop:2492 length:561 start_codon:yes stop_codon:yes gene_type:complete